MSRTEEINSLREEMEKYETELKHATCGEDYSYAAAMLVSISKRLHELTGKARKWNYV